MIRLLSSFVVGGRGLGVVGAPFFLRCAVADRTIVLAQNKRHAVRGVTVVNPQEFSAYQEDDDDLTYIVDMSSYLDGATISSVTRTPTGVTVSNTSNTTTRITQRLKGFGYVDFKVTSSSGDVEEFRLTIQPRASRVSTQIAQVPTEMPLATTSTSDPTASDDTTRNFYPGSVWINTSTQNIFDCVVNTQSAARWRMRRRILAHSAVALPLTGTISETILQTVSIAANVIGPTGTVIVTAYWSMTNNANSKTARVRFGASGSGTSGTNMHGPAQSSVAGYRAQAQWANRNSATSQVSAPSGLSGGWITSTGTNPLTASIDTTAATEICLTGALANAGDTLTLEYYTIELTRPDIT